MCDDFRSNDKQIKSVYKHLSSEKHLDKCKIRNLKKQEVVNVEDLAKKQYKLSNFAHLAQNLTITGFVQKSKAFSAAELSLQCTQQILNSIVGEEGIQHSEIQKLNSAGFVKEGRILSRLKVATQLEKTNQYGGKKAVVLHRTGVSDRVEVLALEAKKSKISFLENAAYVCFSIDESSTKKNKSAPLYIALSAVDDKFDYANMFLDQENSAGFEGTRDIFLATQRALQKYKVFDGRLVACATDGASAMRSTPEYSGVDARGEEGSNVVAYFKTAVKMFEIDPIALHCIAHMSNLGLGDMVQLLKDTLLPVLQRLYGYYGKSSKEQSRLQEIARELKIENVSLKRNAATRWSGLDEATISCISNWPLLEQRKKEMIESGYV